MHMNFVMLLALVSMMMHGNVYSNTCIVVNANYETDVVTMSTASGMIYEFEGIEDYWYGDLVSVTFWNNGTMNDVTDDVILSTKYAGDMELFNEALYLWERR
jgi:hypothetical protein